MFYPWIFLWACNLCNDFCSAQTLDQIYPDRPEKELRHRRSGADRPAGPGLHTRFYVCFHLIKDDDPRHQPLFMGCTISRMGYHAPRWHPALAVFTALFRQSSHHQYNQCFLQSLVLCDVWGLVMAGFQLARSPQSHAVLFNVYRVLVTARQPCRHAALFGRSLFLWPRHRFH